MAQNQPEVGNVAPRLARNDEFALVGPTNPMTFVALSRNEVMGSRGTDRRASVLRPKPKVKVPASRACPDADKSKPDGTPLCDWQGWTYDEAVEKLAPKSCPGKRWDGRPCGKELLFKNEEQRYLQFSEYQFVAKTSQQARFLSTKFPKDSDLADDYFAMNYSGAQNGMTQPGKGRTWRQFLDQDILPTAHRNNPGESYNRNIACAETGEVTEFELPLPMRVR